MALIFALIFSVTIQHCLDEVCIEVCNGTITTPPGQFNVYRIECAQEIFKDGFD